MAFGFGLRLSLSLEITKHTRNPQTYKVSFKLVYVYEFWVLYPLYMDSVT